MRSARKGLMARKEQRAAYLFLLDRLTEDAARRIDAVATGIGRPDVEARRWIANVRILAALGRFFAGKLRSAVCYELHAATGSRETLGIAIEAYRAARRAWLEASACSTRVYANDLTFGPQPRLRGHWADRMLAIDADLRDMERRSNAQTGSSAGDLDARGLLQAATRPAPPVEVHHVPPDAFRPGEPLELRVQLRGEKADRVRRMTLRSRPMNQALPISDREMDRTGDGFACCVPGGDLGAEYPLAYAFVLHGAGGVAWRCPGLGESLTDQPYFVVRPVRRRPPRGPAAGS